MLKRICKICGKIFFIFPSGLKAGKGKHCSRKCQFEMQRHTPNRGTFKKGHKIPKKWREASSKAQKGKILSIETRQKMSKSRMGHKVSQITRKKLSIAHKGKKLNYPVWNKGKKLPHLSGENACHWKGGKKKDKWGYIYIYQPHHPFNIKKYVLEHRLIMEKHIGRFLTKKEIVHHINGNRSDNRLENLMLFPNNSAHGKFHSFLRTTYVAKI